MLFRNINKIKNKTKKLPKQCKKIINNIEFGRNITKKQKKTFQSSDIMQRLKHHYFVNENKNGYDIS